MQPPRLQREPAGPTYRLSRSCRALARPLPCATSVARAAGLMYIHDAAGPGHIPLALLYA